MEVAMVLAVLKVSLNQRRINGNTTTVTAACFILWAQKNYKIISTIDIPHSSSGSK